MPRFILATSRRRPLLPFIGLHRTRLTRVSAVSLSGGSNSSPSARGWFESHLKSPPISDHFVCVVFVEFSLSSSVFTEP